MHDEATLDAGDFSLERTLAAQSIAAGTDPAVTSGPNLFHDLWDTQNTAAAARRAAVHKLVADEPPRRTVTGHFRVH